MKKLTFLSIIVLLMATYSVPAQNSDYKWAVGLNWNWVDFHVVHRSVPDQFKYAKWQGYAFPSALTVGRYLNPSFNVLGEFGVSKLETTTMSDLGQPLSDGKFWTADLNLAYKFANGYLLKQSARLDPYIYVGLGAASIKDDKTVNKTTYLKQVTGIGVNFWLLEKVALTFQGSYDYIIAPKIEYEGTNKSAKRDDFMHFTTGIKFRLGVKDTDKDGVPDKDDLCPDVPGKVELAGCPDKDNDGIADKDDACPDVAGKPEFKGCPDTDGDGIPDKDDKCPTLAGKKELNGCPDKDNDGIADGDDACPDVAGKAEFKGCPDTDGDGIIDKDDRCPTEAGKKELKGCPDRDNDGVADIDDKCPDVAGTIANNGCPEVPKFDLYKVVYFNSDKSVVITKYTKDLVEVATILKANPEVNVTIDGYADSQGPDAYNVRLSEKRADYVINFLAKKGVDKSRMVKSSFGETKPVADNNTAEGRAQNRRVEIKAINK